MFDSKGWVDPPDHLTELPEEERRALRDRAEAAVGLAAAHASAALAEMLGHLATFEATGGWFDAGAKSSEDWVVWRCGVTPSEARYMVKVARKLAELPKIGTAFSSGELSYWQVKAMIPVATEEIEDALLDMARHTTAGQLARLVRAYKGCLDRIELENANERYRYRTLHHYFDDDGFLVISGRLSPEDGAVLVAALEAAEQSLQDEVATAPTGTVEDEMTPAKRRADALVEVARRSLANQDAGRAPGRPEVVVHVDVPSLIDGSGGRCELDDGPSLASETARRLACDATIQAVYEDGGKALDYGRRYRTIPPRLRRALEQRDVTCVFPGCERRRHREGHHIVHWTHDGETDPSNVALFCYHHHRLVHEGGFRVEGDAEGELTFYRPDGRVVTSQPRRERTDLGELLAHHKKAGLTIDPETCKAGWDGQAIDYDACVYALLQEGGLLALPRKRSP